MKEYICTFCSVNDISPSYVVRNQLIPTSEAENSLNDYNTTNEEIISRYLLLVIGTVVTTAALEANGPFIESYLTDQATVWEN